MAIEYFTKLGIDVETTTVNRLFAERTTSAFRIPKRPKNDENDAEYAAWSADDVTIAHLMSHHALNMHYVNGVPLDVSLPRGGMPPITDFLTGNPTYGYVPIHAIHPPGTVFQYSGGGFIVLEHLLEAHSGRNIHELADAFFSALGMANCTFRQWNVDAVAAPSTAGGGDGERTSRAYAVGRRDDGSVVKGTRLMFPAFAAGAMSPVAEVVTFLQHLTRAYQTVDGSGPLSHDTARLMLHGFDHGCKRFMGCLMGLGAFTCTAGDNQFVIHQGANDGFRSIFVHCFHGPDRGVGFCVAVNADLRAVGAIAELAQFMLTALEVQGIDRRLFKATFDTDHVKPEELVNTGYRELIFHAFCPQRAERIDRTAASLLPLSHLNLIVPRGSEEASASSSISNDVDRDFQVIACTNDRFARCENVLSPFEPVFDPALFGRQGKVMDSWESVRHNPNLCDVMTFLLPKGSRPSRVRFVEVSTKFHLGNQAPAVRILGHRTVESAHRAVQRGAAYYVNGQPLTAADVAKDEVTEILSRTPLAGHSLLRIDLGVLSDPVEACSLQMFPDGGWTRVALFDDRLVPLLKEHPDCLARPFSPPTLAKGVPFDDPIPKTANALVEPFRVSTKEGETIAAALRRNVDDAVRAAAACDPRSDARHGVNVANAALGARLLGASNEHYGPAVQVISPLPPLNMFDGLESARSRIPGSCEWVIIQLAWPCRIDAISLDFTYFVNNNPKDVSVDVICADSASSATVDDEHSERHYLPLVPRTHVKPFAASTKVFKRGAILNRENDLTSVAAAWSRDDVVIVRVRTFPCGGINRVKVFSLTLPPPQLLSET